MKPFLLSFFVLGCTSTKLEMFIGQKVKTEHCVGRVSEIYPKSVKVTNLVCGIFAVRDTVFELSEVKPENEK